MGLFSNTADDHEYNFFGFEASVRMKVSSKKFWKQGFYLLIPYWGNVGFTVVDSYSSTTHKEETVILHFSTRMD